MEKVSFVVPVFNEKENIEPLCQAISSAMKATSYPYEMILVNDGSSDDTWAEISRVAGDYMNLVGIDLITNYGQSSALSAGIDQAVGELIVLMDGDMQNDPADVPMMIETLKEEDCDVVSGERIHRKDSAIFRRIPSRIANYFIRLITGVKLKDYGCALRVFRSDIARNLGLYGELHRFIPVLAVLQGALFREVDDMNDEDKKELFTPAGITWQNYLGTVMSKPIMIILTGWILSWFL